MTKRTREKPDSDEILADRIARDLFTNGQGSRAARLALMSASGLDLGGWSESAMADRIAAILRRSSRAHS